MLLVAILSFIKSKCLLGIIYMVETIIDPSEMAMDMMTIMFYVENRKITEQCYGIANEKPIMETKRTRGLVLTVLLCKVVECHLSADIWACLKQVNE